MWGRIRNWFGRTSAPAPAPPRYESQPAWGTQTRSFEAAETNRLNAAHWQNASDVSVNTWIASQLSILRARATYESRQNGTLAGILGTYVNDIVGPDGPELQIQSDDTAYNEALEQVWRDWFKAPTFRPNVSGAAMLKMWIRNLPRCGEFLAVIGTDPNAEGPVQLRLRPLHPRRLASPFGVSANGRSCEGIEFDSNDVPVRYWINTASEYGYTYTTQYTPFPPDLVIHEFIADEEGQARGFPWLTSALQPTADLRDYDRDVQEASRRSAQNNGMMYTDSVDAPVWTAPEETTIEPGVIPMAPPGWKPFAFQATQPAAQYPDYRAERQRELGLPLGMPLMIVRLDSSKSNYSSARFDGQSYTRGGLSIQSWLSGTEKSYGTLNRLVDLIAAEARFSVPALRKRPAKVAYVWTWTPRPHVDPSKEADAELTGLESSTLTLTEALALRGSNLETHLQTLVRERRAFTDAGLTPPAWMTGAQQASSPEARATRAKERATEDEKEEAAAK